jgi:hypothetical protein
MDHRADCRQSAEGIPDLVALNATSQDFSDLWNGDRSSPVLLLVPKDRDPNGQDQGIFE